MLSHLEFGEGQPLVFLHGNPDCKECWLPIIKELSKEYRCIAVDLPGFGKEAVLPSYRSLLPDQLADSLMNTLESLGINEKVVLVVHDLGAYMAAAMLMNYPEKVLGMVSMNTTFSKFYFGHLWGYLWCIPVLGPLFGKVMQLGFEKSLAKESPLVQKIDAERMVANLNWTTCRAITRYYQIMYNPLVKLFQLFNGEIYENNFPVRVLWGVEDHYIPLIYARLHDEVVQLVEGASHWLPHEKPAIVVEEIKRFITQRL